MTNAIEVNCQTGEVTERPLTAKELQQRELDAIAYATSEQERQVEAERIAALKESAKAKLIAGEPLTGDEAAVLVI